MNIQPCEQNKRILARNMREFSFSFPFPTKSSHLCTSNRQLQASSIVLVAVAPTLWRQHKTTQLMSILTWSCQQDLRKQLPWNIAIQVLNCLCFRLILYIHTYQSTRFPRNLAKCSRVSSIGYTASTSSMPARSRVLLRDSSNSRLMTNKSGLSFAVSQVSNLEVHES